jgi:dipeptidyl-peptidase-3
MVPSTFAASALALALSATPASHDPQTFLRERLGNHAVVQLFADRFSELSPRERAMAFFLSLAGSAGEEIGYDQRGWSLVAAKRLLETVYLFADDGSPAAKAFHPSLREYLIRFYSHGGNHDQNSSTKFLPGFRFEDLVAAARRAQARGAPLEARDAAELEAKLAALRPTLFDAAFEPMMTAKTPPAGQDILTASSNTAYEKGIALAELQGLRERYPLNSRVVREGKKLAERVFRAGTPDGRVAPGLYATELRRVIAHLSAARGLASKEQSAVLGKLQRFFQTGEAKDWDAYNIAWLRSDPKVDASVGFVESYVDARGQKGQWQANIAFKEPRESRVMELLSKKSQYFEDKMPWPAKYKRRNVPTPVATAISFIHTQTNPPAGVNLPNELRIRERYGSKSVSVINTMATAYAVVRLPLALEFTADPEEKKKAQAYGAAARALFVAFHEVTGHASGRIEPRLKGSSAPFLKEFDNTLEEARADLVALWHAFDPALKEVYPEADELAREMYRNFLVEGLTDLRRVEHGDSFEEDHQRAKHMMVSVFLEKGVARLVERGGKRYLEVVDYAKMREAAGELLSTLMVIKATGDYAAIRALVEEKGIRIDPKLRDEVVARVKAANIPTVLVMVSPRVTPVLDAKGAVVDAKLSSSQKLIEQHLERSLLGRTEPSRAAKVAAELAPLEGDAFLEALRARWGQVSSLN